jgi:hypothetical protein
MFCSFGESGFLTMIQLDYAAFWAIRRSKARRLRWASCICSP